MGLPCGAPPHPWSLLRVPRRWVFNRTVKRMQAEGLPMPGHNTARLAKHKGELFRRQATCARDCA